MKVITLAANFPPLQKLHLRAFRAKRNSVFLPKEHGSWSLALEPLCLGLLVAPSRAGTALALAAIAAFFARRPLRSVLTADSVAERYRALPVLGLFGLIAAAGLFHAYWLCGLPALWPLWLVIPLGGLFVYFDLQNESRAALAEIVGSSAFSLLPAAIASLAGWPRAAALGIALVALARNLPTVLTIRTYLRQTKGQAPSALLPLLAAGFAFAAMLGFHSANLVPLTCVLGTAFLLCRTAWLLSSWRPRWSARRLGQLEAALGLLYVILIAATYHLTNYRLP